MSPRAAWRLESLGFGDVYDYVAGKVDWMAAGLPTEGTNAQHPRAGEVARKDVPTAQLDERLGDVRERVQAVGWDAAVVINSERVVLGLLRSKELEKDPNPVKVWVKAFRGTLHSEDRMCPAAVLGASSIDLPVEVSAEVKKFFKMCHDKLVDEGLSSDEASQLLATITGALVVANAVNDFAVYDRATREFTRARKPAPAKASRQRSK